MDFIITINGAPLAALVKALAAYNTSNPGAPLTEPQLVQRLVDGQLEALVASYLKTKIRPVDFLQRFTPAERVAIRTAAQTNAAIDDYLQMLAAVGAGELDLTHELTIAGVQALEAAQLLAPGRAAEILAL